MNGRNFTWCAYELFALQTLLDVSTQGIGLKSQADVAIDICRAFLHGAKRFPCLMLARDGKELLGTVALEKADILPPDYRARPPWMTCVFVAPAGRGRGLGRYLTQCGIAEATALGFPHLWLWTELHNFDMYKRYGMLRAKGMLRR